MLTSHVRRSVRFVGASKSPIWQYYVPFVERPRYTLSVETIRTLEEAVVANPSETTLNESRTKLAAALVPCLGQRLIVPSPHLWPGTVMTSPLFAFCFEQAGCEVALVVSLVATALYLASAVGYYTDQPFSYRRVMALCAK